MPRYEYENTETGERFHEYESWSSSEARLKENTNLKRVIGAPNIVGGTGGIKTDGGWQETMSRVAEAHPNSAVGDRFGTKSAKDIKTKQVLEKHRNKANK
jgi:predicted nucleic acid-binding Zn ribbon protein